MDNSAENTYILKKEIYSPIKGKLVINPDYIKFTKKSFLSSTEIKFDINNISGYKYGIYWIRGLEFTIGREYQIYLKDHNNKVLKLKFRTYYGYKKEKLHQTYASIHSDLWHTYFKNIASDFLNKFEKEQPFEISGVKFTKDGVTIKTSGILREEDKSILWKEIDTHDYQTYFVIFSKKDPMNINRGYSYKEDWNTDILFNVIRTILNSKNAPIS